MKIIPWLVFIGSTLLLIAMFSMVSGREPKTPEQVLIDTRAQLDLGQVTRQAAIRDLDSAIRLANKNPESDLLAKLHMARGRIFFEMGGFDRAGEDFERVLVAYRPGARRAETLLADVDIELRDFDSAEARLDEILEKYPNDARAWVQRGTLGKIVAEALVEECYSTFDDSLVPEDAEAAKELLLAIAARDIRDPSRVAIIFRLRSFFSGEDDELVRDLLDRADDASRAYERARLATARSLQNDSDLESAAQMMELFAMAGRHSEATSLGELVLASDDAEVTEEFTLVMLRSYKALGQPARARDILSLWTKRGRLNSIRSEEFFVEACEAMLLARAWPDLGQLASKMRWRNFSPETNRLGHLYQGISWAQRGEVDEQAIYSLSKFFAGLEHELFPGSRAIGYRAKAQAQQNLGSPDEIESLIGVYTFDPDCSGGIHLRLSRLMQAAPNRGAVRPLFHMTAAMSKMPKLTSRLMPEWIELGEKEIATSSINMDVLYESLKEDKTWVQGQSTSAYRMWLFGKRFLEDEEWVGLNANAKRALSLFPGFLPALDHRIEAELQLGNVDTTVELLLERIDRAGIDEQATVWLNRIPSAGKSNEHILRLMRADPATTGRANVIRTMIEDGEQERALSMLLSSEDDSGNKLAAARIQSELGRHSEAAKLLPALLEKDPDSLDLRILHARNRLAVGTDLEFEDALDALLDHRDVSREILLLVVDELIRDTRYDLALSMLEKVDHRVELRGGDMLMRTGLVYMLQGDYLQAETYLERADAFQANGAPELARVFLCLENRDWPELAIEAEQATNSDLQLSPLSAAILAVLSEDLESARMHLEVLKNADSDPLGVELLSLSCDDFEGLSTPKPEAQSPKLARDTARLLRGSREHHRDPREALGLLLAFEVSGWMPWARHQVAALDPQVVGPVWQAFCDARIKNWEGDTEAAIKQLKSLHLVRPEFAPAWDLHEEILAAEFDSDDHPRLERFRLKRAAKLLDSHGEPAEALLVGVMNARADEAPEKALKLCADLIERFPSWPRGYATLALLQVGLNRHDEAIHSLASAIEHSEPSPNLRYVSRLFATINSARSHKQAFSSAEEAELLKQLALHLPHDPRISLRLAELDIELEPVDPVAGVDRAFARLERFRSETELTLNQLRPGMARRWVKFISEVDIEQAERLLDSELLKRPGELELWLLRGDLLRSRGQFELALENCDLLLQMLRDTTILRDQITLLEESGAGPNIVLSAIRALEEIQPGAMMEPSLLVARTGSILQRNVKTPPGSLRTLKNLWRNRDKSGSDPESIAKLGLLYVRALLQAGLPDSRTNARRVLEVLLLEQTSNSYTTAFFKSLLGLTINNASNATAELDGSD